MLRYLKINSKMLPLPTISTLLNGTAFYTFYRWTINKGYLAKQNLKQFAPKFLTENSSGWSLKRYIPTNFKDSLNNRISRERYVWCFLSIEYFLIEKSNNLFLLSRLIEFFDVGGPQLFSRDVDYCLPNYNQGLQQY